MTPTEAVQVIKELHRRVESDQAGRAKLTEWIQKYGFNGENIHVAVLGAEKAKILSERDTIISAFTDDDDRNTAWLKSVVNRYGWLSIRLVGIGGAHDAWILVQHAGRDRGPDTPFMRQCLDLMSKMPQSEIIHSDFAYLKDRVLEQEGKKQFYGTQVHPEGDHMVPNPIEDEEHVDHRRAEMGLGSLANYLKTINADLGGK